MGEDKFSLILVGKTFLEIAAENLAKAGMEEVFVSAASKPFAFAGGLKIINDIFANKGALSGIHSALVHSEKPLTFILACDFPFVTADLINFLMNSAKHESEFDAFVPVQPDGRIQPLCAVYKTETCRRILSEMLENDPANYSVRDFLDRLKTRYIEFSEIANLPNSEQFFINVNTPEDFKKAEIIAYEKYEKKNFL